MLLILSLDLIISSVVINKQFIYRPPGLGFLELNSYPAYFDVRLYHLLELFFFFNIDIFNIKIFIMVHSKILHQSKLTYIYFLMSMIDCHYENNRETLSSNEVCNTYMPDIFSHHQLS